MKIGEYLIRAIQETGVRHVFGIQGDYVLNFYNQLCKSPLTVINTCDEQGAGFAADGYARTSGFGVACVTYGVGGLKLANSTAQAFAEKSPVLVISGAPGMGERTHDPLLHHKIRSFETQLNVFREMTAAQAVLTDGDRAAAEINRVIATIKEEKRPGYIELPRDMVDVETEVPGPSMAKPTPAADQGAIDEALDRALSLLMAAHRPIILAGAEAHRFGLQEMLADFIDRSGLFFATGLLGKSVISEHHPKFIGVYAGAMSPDDVREAVEEADCIIGIGPFITDLSSGMFTQRISDEHVVKLTPEGVHVGYSFYPGIAMKDFLAALTAALPLPEHIRMSVERRVLPPFVPEIDREITMERLVTAVNTFLDDTTTVIAEAGDPLFGALDIRVHGTNEFMSPAYYASLGFAVPAAIAVQLAAPDRRPLALVGDGSFQMTGVEISTAVRYGLSPIVLVLNNGGYGTFRTMVDGPQNDLQPWQYAEITRIIGGGEGFKVSTEEDLLAALTAARENRRSPTIIEVSIGKHDFSARLRHLTENLKKRV